MKKREKSPEGSFSAFLEKYVDKDTIEGDFASDWFRLQHPPSHHRITRSELETHLLQACKEARMAGLRLHTRWLKSVAKEALETSTQKP